LKFEFLDADYACDVCEKNWHDRAMTNSLPLKENLHTRFTKGHGGIKNIKELGVGYIG
jgi:hypothetical protein